MVFTNRRKWSTNNEQQTNNNQTKTYTNDKIDINKFLLIGEDNENKQSLNTMNALWYAVTLEPVAVQNQRCSKFLISYVNIYLQISQSINHQNSHIFHRLVMFFECIAIFGALLVGAVWIIFEWRYSTMVERYNTTLDRVFDCIMGIALISNVFLTVLASWFWVS